MTDMFRSERGALVVDKAEDEQGHTMRVLTPTETAQVGGGILLLYWLLVQPAY